ncbi:MAG: flagellar basal body rod C-terminal domain-containing protein [Planctomycetota bacterium]|jgi:flagellar basal-body rod protein FlgC
MDIGMHTSLSSIRAFTDRVGVQGNNIANVNTDGFKRGRTLMSETQPAGVQNRYEKVSTPGPLRVEGGEVIEGSNTDLTEEIPQNMISQRGMEANTAAVRTQDEMLGTVIDLLA